ncbi:MAG: DUF2993 domain-containing protein [Actinocatenispora sp.]
MAVGGMTRPRRRRGRRALIVLLVLLLLLLVALVVADRVGRSVADDKLAEQVSQHAQQQGIQLGQQPTADITGFPFLTQVAAGRYDEILFHLRDVQAQGYSLPKLDVAAHGVHAKASDVINHRGTISADRVDGTATLGYGYLEKVIKEEIDKKVEVRDLTLTGSDGKLMVHATVPILGQQLKLVGETKLTLQGDGRRVRVDVRNLRPDGIELPAFAKSALNEVAQQLSTTITLPELPYHLQLTGLEPASEGLLITARASHVSLSQ